MTANAETTLVYNQDGLLHFPGPNPGTPYTACGLDAGLMHREERPLHWAGVWCSECLRKLASSGATQGTGTGET